MFEWPRRLGIYECQIGDPENPTVMHLTSDAVKALPGIDIYRIGNAVQLAHCKIEKDRARSQIELYLPDVMLPQGRIWGRVVKIAEDRNPYHEGRPSCCFEIGFKISTTNWDNNNDSYDIYCKAAAWGHNVMHKSTYKSTFITYGTPICAVIRNKDNRMFCEAWHVVDEREFSSTDFYISDVEAEPGNPIWELRPFLATKYFNPRNPIVRIDEDTSEFFGFHRDRKDINKSHAAYVRRQKSRGRR